MQFYGMMKILTDFFFLLSFRKKRKRPANAPCRLTNDLKNISGVRKQKRLWWTRQLFQCECFKLWGFLFQRVQNKSAFLLLLQTERLSALQLTWITDICPTPILHQSSGASIWNLYMRFTLVIWNEHLENKASLSKTGENKQANT